MKSITARLVIGTSVVLAVFVVLVALSVSYSVHQRANTARLDKLQGMVYGILGATDITDNATLRVNSLALPDSRLNQSISGLYAELVGSDGSILWHSTSSTSWIPDTEIRPIGDWQFELLESERRVPLHRLQLSTAWAFDNGEELPFIVHVVDEADSLGRQLRRFDQTLWATLLGSAAIVLMVQFFVLRHSLKPLHELREEVAAIERGEADSLNAHVPRELAPLTRGLNALLTAERERHAQYRHLLDDLAHSLKTPLSVLQNLSTPDSADKGTLLEQTQLMRQSIDRHTQRASIRSPRYLAPVINVAPVVERICHSLQKLFSQQAVEYRSTLDTGFTVQLDEADLYELLGNILENAGKYGASKVLVSGTQSSRCLIVDDDGPGFPQQLDPDVLTQRGVRADSQTQGSGMGLAAARQLMAEYGGQLELGTSPLGGAQVRLSFARD